MPNFHYKVKNADGKTEEGETTADDRFALSNMLRGEGKTPIHIEEIKSKKGSGGMKNITLFSRIKLRDKILFFRNMGSMIQAGLPISRALGVLEKQTKNPLLKGIMFDVNTSITKGQSLASALEKHSKYFSKLETSMIHVGEESGNLVESLSTMSNQLEKSYQLKKKIKSAMMYPSIIFCVMIIIAVLMFMFVVPTLTATFKDLGTELPASTEFVIWISDTLKDNPLSVVLVFVGIIGGFIIMGRTARGKRMFNFISLRLPVIATMVKEYNTAQTTRTLSSLLSSGVGVIESITISIDVVQNVYYKKVLSKTAEDVQKGIPLSESFVRNEFLFPPIASAMIQVGEETGQLSDMLKKVAAYYEEEVDTKTKDLSVIIEPLLMVVIGGAVGFFAVSMISPMYSVMSGI